MFHWANKKLFITYLSNHPLAGTPNMTFCKASVLGHFVGFLFIKTKRPSPKKLLTHQLCALGQGAAGCRFFCHWEKLKKKNTGKQTWKETRDRSLGLSTLAGLSLIQGTRYVSKIFSVCAAFRAGYIILSGGFCWFWLGDALEDSQVESHELLESASRCGSKMRLSHSSQPVDSAARFTWVTWVVHSIDPGCLCPFFCWMLTSCPHEWCVLSFKVILPCLLLNCMSETKDNT